MGTRGELIAAIEARYRACVRSEKHRILDEFIAVSGYHRKHAIRLLRNRPDEAPVRRRPRVVYGPDVREALIVLWETSDRVCAKREVVIEWCGAAKLEVTRARAYRKNDQAWVEQKNGAIVRRLVEYGRFEGVAAAQALSRLYEAARLHTNLFQPSFKLKTKTRIGARVVKRYHAPVPPLLRAVSHPGVSEADKDRLKVLRSNSDPVLLLAEIRAAQEDLGRRLDRRGLDGGSEPIVVDLERFTSSLKTAWRDGEQRPTHRRAYRRRKPVPRRAGMADGYESQVRAWLEAQPSLSAHGVLARLIEAMPEKFNARHLRTIQRAVKVWRGQIARKLTRLSQLAANNRPGVRFPAVGSCKVGTTGAAVIAISECRLT